MTRAAHSTFWHYRTQLATSRSRQDQWNKTIAFIAVIAIHAVALVQVREYFSRAPDVFIPERLEMQVIVAPTVPAPAKPSEPRPKTQPPEVKSVPPRPSEPMPSPEPAIEQVTPVTPVENTQSQEPIELPQESVPPIAAAEPVIIPAKYDADYLDNPKPVYPALARRLRLQGTVILRVTVAEDGHVEDVQVAESSGTKLLDDTATATVLKWRFVPAKQGDHALRDIVHVPIRFNLAG